jgi:hypothetical protein
LEAFTEIDRLTTQMVRVGAPSDAIDLIVDEHGEVVSRDDAIKKSDGSRFSSYASTTDP